MLVVLIRWAARAVGRVEDRSDWNLAVSFSDVIPDVVGGLVPFRVSVEANPPFLRTLKFAFYKAEELVIQGIVTRRIEMGIVGFAICVFVSYRSRGSSENAIQIEDEDSP